MTSLAYFTIASANYLPYARTLHGSLLSAGCKGTFHAFVADEVEDRLDTGALGFPCIETHRIGLPNHFDMAARYSVMEMNTAVKPACIRWLFEHTPADAAVYLDPDILVLRPLRHVQNLLERGVELVLTPHVTAPLPEPGFPDDVAILRTGTYNLGFGAFRRSDAILGLLDWWGRKLESQCVVDLEGGLFVDQKFMDLAPALVEQTFVLRHPGYNAAYWNLAHRPVTRAASGTWKAGGEDLHFFHFSGVVPGDSGVFSKHQNRFTVEGIGPLRRLLDEYLRQLEANRLLDGVDLPRLPYAYGALQDGTPITDDMRRAYATLRRPLPRSYEEAFGPDMSPYVALAPEVGQDPGVPITRLLHAIWQSRGDVRAAFPLGAADGRRGLVGWFLNTGHSEHAVPDRLVADLRRRADAPDGADASGFAQPTHQSRPWRSSPAGSGDGAIPVNGAWAGPLRIDGSLLPGLGILGYFRAETGVGMGARANWHAACAARIPVTAHLLETPTAQERVRSGIPLHGAPTPYDCILLQMNADQAMRVRTLVDPALLAGRHRIGFFMWELERFPDAWLPAFDEVDEVWCPSRFVAQAVAARTRKPVCVVPLAVEPPASPTAVAGARARFGIPEDRLAFLAGFDLDSYVARKNPAAALRAFQAAFPDRGASRASSQPVLVLKCHGRIGRGGAFAELLREAVGDDRVVIVDRVLTPEEVTALQSCCDAFVSLHRSEGFGLWLAECMALGKPVVATGYSGNADFMDRTNSIPIGYKLAPVGPGEYPHGEDQRWAEPNRDEAVEALRALAGSSTLRTRLGTAARTSIAETLSYRRVGSRMAARLAAARVELVAVP